MRRPATLAALLAAVMIRATASGATPAPPPATAEAVYPNDTAATRARLEMRRLWTEHTVLTHTYIVCAVADLPDAEFVVKRALQNADDIATAVTMYYSNTSATKLSALMRQHVMLFTDAVRMAKMSEKDEMGPVQEKLEGNAREMVSFLASANPNWKSGELRDMMDQFINHENDELMARIDHDWDGELTAWNEARTARHETGRHAELGTRTPVPRPLCRVN
jgi:hypothetical protein